MGQSMWSSNEKSVVPSNFIFPNWKMRVSLQISSLVSGAPCAFVVQMYPRRMTNGIRASYTDK